MSLDPRIGVGPTLDSLTVRIEPVPALEGHVAVPGDKSISHRAVLLGAVSEGETLVAGFGRSADTESTIAAVRALGVDVVDEGPDTLRVCGVGLHGLRPGDAPIDCGNSGTLMRLVAGLLVGQEARAELVGDASLSSRPMERIAEPLRRMGATVETTDGHAPLVLHGGLLHGIDYELPVASAQVKSAILLAGLRADAPTTVVEPIPTRDHTERMLEHAGVRVTRRPTSVTVERAESAQSPFGRGPGGHLVGGAVPRRRRNRPGLVGHGARVGLNPRRAGLLDVLERMGARIAIYNRRSIGGEPAGDVEVRASELVGATILAAEVPSLIDELPILAVAACHARGETIVRGAGELRAKESDRIEAVVELLHRIGGHIRATRDGFRIKGVPARLRGGVVDSYGDHRLAMFGRDRRCRVARGVELRGAEAAAVSFPGFFEVLEQIAHGAVHYPPAT